jgi:SAM-dependent methyltransferase
MQKNKQWFESWFDSPYYHILYKHRDDIEAELFIDTIYTIFKILPQHTILDLGCGKGRHSLYMAQKKNNVLGVDLAANSILEAQKTALKMNIGSNLEFQVGDMRNFNLDIRFDFVLNLFTSFGYFDDKTDNLKVIESIARHQSTGGILLIDYFNSQLVRKNGEVKNSQLIDGIEFHTYKQISEGHVIKDIQFSDQGIDYQFQEKVQLFEADEIESMLRKFGYKLIGNFGDFNLNAYNENSPRSIIVGIKE